MTPSGDTTNRRPVPSCGVATWSGALTTPPVPRGVSVIAGCARTGAASAAASARAARIARGMDGTVFLIAAPAESAWTMPDAGSLLRWRRRGRDLVGQAPIGGEQLLQNLVVIRLLPQARILAREVRDRQVGPAVRRSEVVEDDGEPLVVRQADVVDHGEVEVADPELGGDVLSR